MAQLNYLRLVGERRTVRLRWQQVVPSGTWWQRLLCRWIAHQLYPLEETTFVRDPLTDELLGMLCARCGGLLRSP